MVRLSLSNYFSHLKALSGLVGGFDVFPFATRLYGLDTLSLQPDPRNPLIWRVGVSALLFGIALSHLCDPEEPLTISW